MILRTTIKNIVPKEIVVTTDKLIRMISIGYEVPNKITEKHSYEMEMEQKPLVRDTRTLQVAYILVDCIRRVIPR